MKIDNIFNILMEDMVSEAISKEEMQKKIEAYKKAQAERKAKADEAWQAKQEENYFKRKEKEEQQKKHDEAMKADDHTKAKTAYNNAANRIKSSLTEFINLCSGVGLKGDEKTDNEVTQDRVIDSETGKNAVSVDKVTGEKTRYTKGKDISKSDFESAKKKVIDALDRYDSVMKDADNRIATYFKYKKEMDRDRFWYVKHISDDIRKKINRVYYDQLTFDELEKDMNGQNRYNADIFDEFYPFVQNLTKRTPPDFVKDQLSSFKGNEETRMKKMENAIYAGDDAYERARNSERLAGRIEDAKYARREEYINNKTSEVKSNKAESDYKSAWYQGKMLTAGDNSKKMVAKGVAKINTKKATEILDKWVSENAPKDKEHTMKLYGSINGRSELGVLVFMPVKPEGESSVEFEGLYAYKVPLAFTKNLQYTDLSALQNTQPVKRSKYVEDKRKDNSWKKQVNEVIGNLLKEESYFNY